MQGDFERALAVLQRYISPFNAKTLLTRALHEHGIAKERMTQADLRLIGGNLRRGLSLFVEHSRRELALREIKQLCGDDALPNACSLEITVEADIARVRSEARRICDAIGADAFTMQKVATIVSELARNMVLYANGGLLEIVPRNSGRRHIAVRALDRGPGIPNLDEVFSGRYKSKTGMGRGLVGTKRLADRFDISSSCDGTEVVAEVAL